MQTFRKLPKMAPKMAPMTVRTGSPGTRTLPEEDGRRRGDVERLGGFDDGDGDHARGGVGELAPDAGAFVAEEDRQRTRGTLGLPDIGPVHRGRPDDRLRRTDPRGELGV